MTNNDCHLTDSGSHKYLKPIQVNNVCYVLMEILIQSIFIGSVQLQMMLHFVIHYGTWLKYYVTLNIL